jgi:hypothetical protein
MAIKIIALFKVNTLEPTAVPKELAASLAPMDQPTAMPNNTAKGINRICIYKTGLR